MVGSERYGAFDVADYLGDLEDVREHLAAALEESEEDPSALPRALGAIARPGNVSELARRVGMSWHGLYKALADGGNPRWTALLKITSALGLRFELRPAS